MVRKWFGLAVLLIIPVLGLSAAAQKNDVSFSIGRTFISDQGVPSSVSEIHYGNALTYEFGYSRRLIDLAIVGVSVEVPVVLTSEQDVNFGGGNFLPHDFKSYFVTPSARFNLFPDAGFSPWVSVGGGYGHFSQSSNLEFGGTNPGPGDTSVGVLQMGLGLDVRVVGPVKLRGEVRDFYSGPPSLNINPNDKQHHFVAGGGLVFSF